MAARCEVSKPTPGRPLTPEERTACKAIADALGEKQDRPRYQIRRMVRIMGAEWVRLRAIEAADLFDAAAPISLRRDGERRTVGGVFFVHARDAAAPMKGTTLPAKDFYRAFFTPGERKKPQPKPAPKVPPKPTKKPVPLPPPRKVEKRRVVTPEPEVYVSRRRA